jgi:lipopolysaccharide biosynthesis regulator YciM
MRADWDAAFASLEDACEVEPDCTRASMIRGHIEAARGHFDAAIEAFEHVAECDIDYVPEILAPLLDCYARAQRGADAEAFLRDITERYQGVSPVLALAKLYAKTKGEPAAIEFLNNALRQRPSVRALMALIDVNLHTAAGPARDNFLILRDLTRKLLEGQAMYRCNRCGFGAKAHHWQCPGCKTWGSVRPIHGVVTE